MVERGSTTFTSPPASSKAAPAKRAPESGALAHSLALADRKGFEPLVELNPTAVFKTAAINHSATYPRLL